MTATPLQNSILELFGLVSIIDGFVFGDIKSFKSQFSHVSTENDYNELRKRLQPVCKRTLRRQVLEYIKYTKRIAILEEFYPTELEQKLYNMVSDYLSRPRLYALPNSQRQLMTMILRKLLASSTYAIAGTFDSLINRLEAKLQRNESLVYEDVVEDFEADEDEWIDDEEAEEFDTEELHPSDIDGIKKEIKDLTEFRDLAARIKRNSKAVHLFTALDKGFEQLDTLGANKKALIFTESRRTQDFLYELLERQGYAGKVVRFNGTNTDPQSREIYNNWLIKNKGTSKITGSPTADKRAAIVDYFKEKATIMIATEAAAEGINLQFCSLIVNYDMPWNPQRIEQRIGRCHRYGQKFDVVVINFLNKSNAADVRVYELLDEKFKLFDGVFGASDEVLGSIGNGVDFEKRISQIYNECRTNEEIERAFDALQEELKEEISEKMIKVRTTLLENFDESVQEKLRDNLALSLSNLDAFEKKLWLLTQFALKDKARFDEDSHKFWIDNGRYEGAYYMASQVAPNQALSATSQIYRIGHPLAQNIISESKAVELPCREIVFDYTHTEGRTALLERLVGSSGWMKVSKISIDSFEQEDHFLFACQTDSGIEVFSEIAERMLMLNSSERETIAIPAEIQQCLDDTITMSRKDIVSMSAERNQIFFDDEMDKLDSWAGDMKVGLEKEIADLDAEIRLRKSEAKRMSSLPDKVAAQREIKEMERKRAEKRMNLFEAQDEIDAKKEDLLVKIEQMLEQKIDEEELFTIRWRIV